MSMMTTQQASLTDFLELLLFSTTPLPEERNEISSNLQPDESISRHPCLSMSNTRRTMQQLQMGALNRKVLVVA